MDISPLFVCVLIRWPFSERTVGYVREKHLFFNYVKYLFCSVIQIGSFSSWKIQDQQQDFFFGFSCASSSTLSPEIPKPYHLTHHNIYMYIRKHLCFVILEHNLLLRILPSPIWAVLVSVSRSFRIASSKARAATRKKNSWTFSPSNQ